MYYALLAPATQASPTPVGDVSDGQLYLGIAVLVLGLLITVLFAAFLGYSLTSYYNVYKATAPDGPPLIETIPPIGLNVVETESFSGMNIDGPPLMEIGKSATFQITDAGGSSPTEAEWSTNPEDAASIVPKGSTALIEPRKRGRFRVVAKVPQHRGSGSVLAYTTVHAKSPEKGSAQGRLPFVGTGYVTLLALPLVLSVVALLGITGALTGEALAAVVSGIVGFLFGQVAASSGSGSQGSQNSPQQ